VQSSLPAPCDTFQHDGICTICSGAIHQAAIRQAAISLAKLFDKEIRKVD
jgi:hypothetical protein